MNQNQNKQSRAQNHQPEYRRLKKEPIAFNPVQQSSLPRPPKFQNNSGQVAPQHQQTHRLPTLEEVQELEINHGTIEDENIQAVAGVKTHPGSFLVVYQGETELLLNKEQLEEYLNQLVFESNGQVNPDLIDVWEKCSIGFGVYLKSK